MDNEIKLSLRLNTKPVQLKWEKIVGILHSLKTFIISRY